MPEQFDMYEQGLIINRLGLTKNHPFNPCLNSIEIDHKDFLRLKAKGTGKKKRKKKKKKMVAI
jgi:hypothetical protein